MDDILVPGSDMDMEFIEQNPEAIFDFITMKSMQERYGSIESPRGSIHDKYSENEAVYQNEVEFETFVQQFPIDDSIAECFAAANENVVPKQEAKFVSGGKRPQVATKYSKLKKKFGFKGSDETSLLSEDEIRSRDSKRSKKGGGVFSKRHKWRSLNNTSKKTVNFSDQSEKSGSENTSDIASVGQQADFRNLSDNNRTDSCSISDSQITSFSETFTQEMDQTVPTKSTSNSSKIPVLHSRPLHGNTYQHRIIGSKNTQHDDIDVFTHTLSGNSGEIMQKIEDMPPTDVLKLRDYHGNNLLHRSVLVGNADVIKYIMENFPEMTSEMNQENETAIEIAAKFGKYECLKVILERNHRRNSLGVSVLNRLLNVCAQYGQPDQQAKNLETDIYYIAKLLAECMSLLLTYLSRDPHNTCTLPGDARGNTAAHVAAKHGHLHCLQALVASGYDVTSANLMQQRPLHVAHQSRSHACFEYLLLLNICEELLASLRTNIRQNNRLNEQLSSVKPSLEHIRMCLKRYGDLCSDTNQLLTENKNCILETLNNLQEDLKLFVQHTSMDSAAKRKEARDKLEELGAEIERLEDTFEFSPLSEMDGALSKLLTSVDDAIRPCDDVSKSEEIEENSSILSSLIRDIHKECMLENWDTSIVYDKYLKDTKTFQDPSDQASYGNYKNIHSAKSTSEHSMPHKTNIYPDDNQTKRTEILMADKTDKDTKALAHSLKGKASENKNGSERRTYSNTQTNEEIRDEEKEDCTTSDNSHLLKGQLKDITNDPCLEKREINSVTEQSDKLPVAIMQTHSDNIDEADVENRNPTERPFMKLLSLDERIDMLIAGERAREKESDVEHVSSSVGSKDSNPDGVGSIGSIYTSTFTSVTSDTSGASDWYSKLGFTSLETTSSDDVTNDTTTDTASYWWDIGDERPDDEPRNLKVSFPYGHDIRRKIHLNLENDGSTYDELREHRLRSHLRSMQQTRYSSNNYRERITTSTGEVIGGFLSADHPAERTESFKSLARDARVVVDVNGALRERNNSHKPMPRPRKRGKPKLFTLEDAIATKPITASEFRERYDRHVGKTSGLLNMKWENMSITDEEEEERVGWSDCGRGYGIRSDTDTTSGSHTPQSYV